MSPIRPDRTVPMSEQNRVLLRVWSAYRCFVLGTAGREEWAHCADALNILESLCAIGKMDSTRHMPHVVKAQAGLVAAAQKQAMNAEQLAALAEVCTQYDNALYKFSAGTLDRAKDYFLAECRKREVQRGESRVVAV